MSCPFACTVKAWFRPQSVPGRQVDVALLHRGRHLVDADPAAGQEARVDLHAHRVLLRAEDLHLRHAADHRDPLGDERLGVLVDRRERQRRRVERQDRGSAGPRDSPSGTWAGSACSAAAGRPSWRSPPGRPGPRRRCRATRLNCSVIWVMPRAFAELIESTPAIVENWRSSGVATDEAMVSGFAPGRLAETRIVGKSTFGRSLTGSRR